MSLPSLCFENANAPFQSQQCAEISRVQVTNPLASSTEARSRLQGTVQIALQSICQMGLAATTYQAQLSAVQLSKPASSIQADIQAEELAQISRAAFWKKLTMLCSVHQQLCIAAFSLQASSSQVSRNVARKQHFVSSSTTSMVRVVHEVYSS